jgi:putative ABC transport system permease protein
VLPKSSTIQDYYAADAQAEVFPEEYVERLSGSGLEGVDNLSPKLSVPLELGGKKLTLTGILPKSEFQAKAAWQGAGIFARPQGCGVVVDPPGAEAPPAQETLVRKRVIDTLEADEILLGADAARVLAADVGGKLTVLGRPFTVSAVLPQTGTVDDSRIFAHLHAVQELTGKGRVLGAIEIVGCCEQISKGLVQKLNALLPEAKVVTIAQVVDTQLRTNRMMGQLSMLFLIIIVLVGGASIANYMYANVFERRREIGTLMALGAAPSVVLRLFLLKAMLLGVAGGAAGYGLGTVAAVTLGPRIAGVPVLPMPGLFLVAVGVALVVSVLASFFPARRAARLEPSLALLES